MIPLLASNRANPHWNESKFLLVNSLNDSLIMNVMDFNDHRKDSELGAASFDLRSLNDDAEQEDLTAPVILGGKPRGVLKFDARFFPVLTPKKLADGSEEPLPESSKWCRPDCWSLCTLHVLRATTECSACRYWRRSSHASSGQRPRLPQDWIGLQSLCENLPQRPTDLQDPNL